MPNTETVPPARVHVYPLGDARAHDTSNGPCPCSPKEELWNEGRVIVIVHNSFDGRELVENARRADA